MRESCGNARKLQESFGKVPRKLRECEVNPEYPANSWLYFRVGRHNCSLHILYFLKSNDNNSIKTSSSYLNFLYCTEFLHCETVIKVHFEKKIPAKMRDIIYFHFQKPYGKKKLKITVLDDFVKLYLNRCNNVL